MPLTLIKCMNNTKTKHTPSSILDENIKILEKLFAGCHVFIRKKFPPGGEGAPWIYTAYIDAITDNVALIYTEEIVRPEVLQKVE